MSAKLAFLFPSDQSCARHAWLIYSEHKWTTMRLVYAHFYRAHLYCVDKTVRKDDERSLSPSEVEHVEATGGLSSLRQPVRTANELSSCCCQNSQSTASGESLGLSIAAVWIIRCLPVVSRWPSCWWCCGRCCGGRFGSSPPLSPFQR
jgi:hypothetical protein